MDASITATALTQSVASGTPPLLIDVRRRPAFLESRLTIAGALRRDPDRVEQWLKTLPGAARVVVYCVHGHQVSQNTAQALREAGLDARYLEGGIDHWVEHGGATATKPPDACTRWITRERPKIDRIACPWLIKRFVDADAEFLYVPAAEVKHIAAERVATPYDVADVTFSHAGDQCSFDAFVRHYRLADPALAQLATIVRGADTGHVNLTPQSAGLLAMSLGLSQLYQDDFAMLEHGLTIYDALYAWCKQGKSGAHTWNPQEWRCDNDPAG